MTFRTLRMLPVAALTVMLGACASDGSGGLFSTSSVTPPAEPVVASVARPKVDPQCVTLATQIDGLRREGTIDRLEKVAAGKGDKVQVKRTAIAKQAELNKANAEFQVKCAPRVPVSQEASLAPATAPVAAAPAAKAAAKAAVTKAAASGVTVAPPQPKAQ